MEDPRLEERSALPGLWRIFPTIWGWRKELAVLALVAFIVFIAALIALGTGGLGPLVLFLTGFFAVFGPTILAGLWDLGNLGWQAFLFMVAAIGNNPGRMAMFGVAVGMGAIITILIAALIVSTVNPLVFVITGVILALAVLVTTVGVVKWRDNRKDAQAKKDCQAALKETNLVDQVRVLNSQGELNVTPEKVVLGELYVSYEAVLAYASALRNNQANPEAEALKAGVVAAAKFAGGDGVGADRALLKHFLLGKLQTNLGAIKRQGEALEQELATAEKSEDRAVTSKNVCKILPMGIKQQEAMQAAMEAGRNAVKEAGLQATPEKVDSVATHAMRIVLYKQLGVLPGEKTKTKLQVAKELLRKIKSEYWHNGAGGILEVVKEAKKAAVTIPVGGVVVPTSNVTDALSSPPVRQIPSISTTLSANRVYQPLLSVASQQMTRGQMIDVVSVRVVEDLWKSKLEALFMAEPNVDDSHGGNLQRLVEAGIKEMGERLAASVKNRYGDRLNEGAPELFEKEVMTHAKDIARSLDGAQVVASVMESQVSHYSLE